MISIELKAVLLIGLYLLCAMMFHRNEQLHHPDDQIGDPVIAHALALFWPLVVFGVVMGLVVRLIMLIAHYTVQLSVLALDWAARQWLNYRKVPCPNPSPN